MFVYLLLIFTYAGGRLTNINTGEGFVYEVRRGKKTYNQRHYEAIGEARANRILAHFSRRLIDFEYVM